MLLQHIILLLRHKTATMTLQFRLLFFIWASFGQVLAEKTVAQDDLNRKVEIAIDNGKRYFSEFGTHYGRSDVPMVVFILQEHFKTDFRLPHIDRFMEDEPELRGSYFQLYDKYFLNRSVPNFPDSIMYHFLETHDSPINVLTIRAMFCNKYPLPSDFVDQLWEMEKKGGYELSHVPLQLINAVTNKCISASDQQVIELLASVERKLVNTINSENAIEDYKYEAMVMLCYMNKCDRLSKANILEVCSKQLDDGGWSYNSFEYDKSDPHASILALWALLEYQQKAGFQ